MKQSTGSAIPLPIALRFGVGQLGAQLFRDTPAVLLPIFMTTMLGVPAWLAGLVVLIPKLWLIICDPAVGAWYDRKKEAGGRARFLLAGAVGTSLAFAALFFTVDFSTAWIAALTICAIFFLGSTAFSIFSVPYLATASEMSSDPFERNRIIVMRMIFGSLGVLIGVGLPQLMIAHFGGGERGWHLTSWILAAICLVSMSITALGLRDAPTVRSAGQAGTMRESLAQVSGNRPFLVLLVATFFSNIGQALSYTVIGFVFLYKVGDVALIPAFILVMAVSSLVAKPLWLWLPRRIGKARCYIGASIAWILVTSSWILLGAAGSNEIGVAGFGALPAEHLLILARAVVIGVANGGFVLLALSIMTDTVDWQRRQGVAANEGVFSGIFSAAEKLAFAVGPLIAGLVMSLFGFAESQGGPAPQADSAVFGIVLLYSLIPAGLQCVALLVFLQRKESCTAT